MAEKKKDPREGHRGRLRDKYLKYGIKKLTEDEILELLVSFGTPRKDCKLTARAMLAHFGTIREVLEAPVEELAAIPGAGPANVFAVKFVRDVSGMFLEHRLRGRDYLNSSREIYEYLRYDLEGLDKEVFKVIFMDTKNTIIDIEDVSRGSVTEALVSPREVLERAILRRAACLAFAHNHPSGNVDPSQEDLRLTRRLIHIAHIAGIMVFDHLIIGRHGEYFSFKDNGLLNLYTQEVGETYKLDPRPGGGLLHEYNPLDYNKIKLKPRRGRKHSSIQTPSLPLSTLQAPVMVSEKMNDETEATKEGEGGGQKRRRPKKTEPLG